MQLQILRGNLVENFVMNEFQKHYLNAGRQPRIYFWRDSQGHEVDCLIEQADQFTAVEIKSSMTFSMSYFDELKYWKSLASGEKIAGQFVVYAGDDYMPLTAGTVVGWQQMEKIFEPSNV